MWKAATAAFPNPSIYIPIITQDRLPLPQQENLRQLNAFICKNFTFLNDVSPLRFKLESHDLIHWTDQTAREILASWLDQLNYYDP